MNDKSCVSFAKRFPFGGYKRYAFKLPVVKTFIPYLVKLVCKFVSDLFLASIYYSHKFLFQVRIVQPDSLLRTDKLFILGEKIVIDILKYFVSKYLRSIDYIKVSTNVDPVFGMIHPL